MCRVCGCIHAPTPLGSGEKASCARCGTLLAHGSRGGMDAALAFAATGLILAIPAITLPFVTVSKFANERVGLLFSGVTGLWSEGMRFLPIWVLVCAGLAPVILLGTLVAALAPLRFGWRETMPRALATGVHAIEQWSMPEVHVLAVLVALTKLHTLVDVAVELGFWCYIALSFVTLVAWRSFEVASLATKPARAPSPS